MMKLFSDSWPTDYIAKGRRPLLNWQNIDCLHFEINTVTYNSVLGFILNRAVVRNLGLDATLSFYCSNRCSLTVCNGICEMLFEVISKSSSRNIDFTLFTQPKLLFLMYFNTFKGNLCSFIIIALFHNFVIHATCLEKGEPQFTPHVVLELEFLAQLLENTSMHGFVIKSNHQAKYNPRHQQNSQ